MNQNPKINFSSIFLALFVGLILLFLVIPTLLVVPMSFTETRYLTFPPQGFSLQWHKEFFTSPRWIEPTIFSLKLASLTTIVSLIIGTMTSLALVKGVFPGKRFFHLLFLSPMIIPLIVTAFSIYGVFAHFGLIGSLLGLVIAHTIIGVPYVILVITANLYRFDTSLELAARNLGANGLKTFIYVTLPLIKPGIITAGIFCFIESLDELVLVLFLVGTTKMTLPLRMFSEIQFQITPTVAAASTIFIIASIGTIMAKFFIDKNDKSIGSKE